MYKSDKQIILYKKFKFFAWLPYVILVINIHQEINRGTGCINLVEYLEVNACFYNTHTQAETTSNTVNKIYFKFENIF